MGDVEMDEAHGPTPDLLPRPQPLADRLDRSERLDTQINVDLAAAEVVDNENVMTGIRQVHRAGPPAEAVTAENENLHPSLLNELLPICIKLLQASRGAGRFS